MSAFIPSFTAFQRVAHFFPKNNDVFYLSSEFINISRNELNILLNKINEKKKDLIKDLGRINYEMYNIEYEINILDERTKIMMEEFKSSVNNMIMNISSFSRSSNFIDCKWINNYDYNEKAEKIFKNVNMGVCFDLLHPLRAHKTELSLRKGQIIDEMNQYNKTTNIIKTIIDLFNNNNGTIKKMELEIKNLKLLFTTSDFLINDFFDFYFSLSVLPFRRQQEEKEIRVIKSIVRKYKAIKKMRENGIHYKKYISLLNNMESEKNQVITHRNVIETYKNEISHKIKKYITGYRVRPHVYKLRPFYEKEHERQVKKYTELFDNVSIKNTSILNEVENMEYYANHHDYNDESHYFKDTDILNKYHNSLLFMKKIRDEIIENNKIINKLTEEIEPYFIDEEPQEDEPDFIDENNDEKEEKIKENIIELMQHAYFTCGFDDSIGELSYKEKNDDEVDVFLHVNGLDILLDVNYDVRYYLHEMINNGVIDEMLEKIENIFNHH